MRFSTEHSSCWIADEGETFVLYAVQTDPSKINQGYASRMIQEVIQFCREAGKPVRLFVKAYYHRTKSDYELIKWYHKQGFKVCDLTRSEIWMEAS